MPGKNIADVTVETFEEDVLWRSQTVPVLVDFWAPWCSPCRTLGPILEKVVGDLGGKIFLAKVNVQECPELAQAYGVQSIPAVKLFATGEVVSEFTGLLPESQLREFVEKALPSGDDTTVAQAEELRREGRLKEAESVARKALAENPNQGVALEICAAAAMARGDVDEALNFISQMESPSKDMQFLADGAEFWRLCATPDAGGKSPQLPQNELDVKIREAACLAVKGEHTQALDRLLEIVQANKSFRDGLARKAMVSVFVVMGLDNPTVKEYQSRLARLLF